MEDENVFMFILVWLLMFMLIMFVVCPLVSLIFTGVASTNFLVSLIGSFIATVILHIAET